MTSGEITYDTTAAFHDLLDLIGSADATFLSGDRAVPDEVSVVEGYQWLTQILAVALECYLWADGARSRMVEITSPTLKWGGDNADAFYWFAPIDPERRYRVTGARGDSAYLSFTIYGGPSDGRAPCRRRCRAPWCNEGCRGSLCPSPRCASSGRRARFRRCG